MKIVCPQCEFTREVAEEKLPTNSVMATCPQCQHRFKVMRETQSTVTYSDNAVPQGAHIPSSNEPLYTQSATQAPTTQEPTPQEEQQKTEDINNDEITDEERQKVAAAYAEQASQTSFAVENPWEHVDKLGYFTAFYQTVIWILFAPSRFFAGLMPQGSRLHVMIFYLVVRALQISIEFFWGGILSSSLEPTAAGDTELQTILELLTPQTSFVFALLMGTAIATIEIFFGSLFYFVMFRFLAADKANFSLVFQVVAYSSAPLLLAIIPALGTIVGFIWSLACILIGCRYSMRLTWSQTILGIAPLYVLGVLSFISLIGMIGA